MKYETLFWRVTFHVSHLFIYIFFLLKNWWSYSVEGLLSMGPTCLVLCTQSLNRDVLKHIFFTTVSQIHFPMGLYVHPTTNCIELHIHNIEIFLEQLGVT